MFDLYFPDEKKSHRRISRKAPTQYNNKSSFSNSRRIDCLNRMIFSLYKKEQYIANQKGKLSFHNIKWKCELPLFRF